MTVISYTSLSAIAAFKETDNSAGHELELTQMGMTQPYLSDQCGAYALVAIATTFGKLSRDMKDIKIEFPPAGSTNIHAGYHSAVLKGTDTFPELAQKIYSVTGIFGRDGTIVDKGGYNSPAALISVAKQLGLSVQLVVNMPLYNKVMAELYPKLSAEALEKLQETISIQYEWCESVLGKTAVDSRTPVRGNSRQLALSLMNTFVNSLHWIAQSSDNTYFDSLRNFYPGNQYGRVGYPWPARPYTNAGMDIVLSNDSAMPGSNEFVKVNANPAFEFF